MIKWVFVVFITNEMWNDREKKFFVILIKISGVLELFIDTHKHTSGMEEI